MGMSIPESPVITYKVVEGENMRQIVDWMVDGCVGPRPVRYVVRQLIDGREHRTVAGPFKSLAAAEQRLGELIARNAERILSA